MQPFYLLKQQAGSQEDVDTRDVSAFTWLKRMLEQHAESPEDMLAYTRQSLLSISTKRWESLLTQITQSTTDHRVKAFLDAQLALLAR